MYIPLITMVIFADLIPEIQHDHLLRYPVPATIDKDLIKDQLLCHRSAFWVNDVNIAIVKLAWLCDIYRGWILLSSATLGLLCIDDL